MYNEGQRVVAGNGTVIQSGGVYLTFSGDPKRPYAVAKVISVGGGPREANSDGKPMPSADLWVKLFRANHVVPPGPMAAGGSFVVMPMSVNMFLAWGPPKFPISIDTEIVTGEELEACVEDWHLSVEQESPALGEGVETTLVVSGQLSAEDKRCILWRLRPSLRGELQEMLVDEDLELRFGVTTQVDDGTVTDVAVHFRVNDVTESVSVVKRLYLASGLSHPARIIIYGPDSDVIATHAISEGTDSADPE